MSGPTRRRPAGSGAVGRLAAGLVLAALVVGPFTPSAGAAPLPADWCAPTPSTTDLPDTVAGSQIHVVYAHPADVPDRTGALATRIARDLAGVDGWWQAQDPTRTPRFDFAAFPGCDSQFGALDISTLALPGPALEYTFANATLAIGVRTALASTVGTTNGKSYLVYLDAPVSFDGGRVVCGMAFVNLAFVFLQQPPGCTAGGGLGTGDAWPARTAAHELAHLFTNGNLTGAAHVCPDDDGHICEPGSNDLLEGTVTAASPFLSGVVLDPDRDDYYGHGLASPVDGRRSDLLARLDQPQQPVTVRLVQPEAGQVASTVPGIACPPACTVAFDGQSTVRLLATAAPGYTFGEWSGDCSGEGVQCTVLADAPRTIVATFDPLVPYRVRVVGDGRVTDLSEVCSSRCTWDDVGKTKVDLYAEPSEGARFAGWSGDCAGTGTHCQVSIGKRTRVVATFVNR